MSKIEKWIEINASPERVFNLFSRFEDFPQWVPSLATIVPLDERRTQWNLAQATSDGQWVTETTAYEPGERIAWRTLRGDVLTEAEATFEETLRGTTLLRLAFADDTSERLSVVRSLFNERPAEALEQSLERFKRLVEQPHDETLQERGAILSEPSDEEQTLVSKSPRETNTAPRQEQTVMPPAPTPRLIAHEPNREAPVLNFLARERPASRLPEQIPLNRSRLILYFLLAVIIGLIAGALIWLAAHRQQEDPNATSGSAGITRSSANASPMSGTRTVNQPVIARDPSQAQSGSDRSQSAINDPSRATAKGSSQAELRTALDEWIAATNGRDLSRQMGFYAPVVERYYLRKNVSRAVVRANKQALAKRARLIDISTSEPEIEFAPDNQTANMRFRKRYNIEGIKNGRGEVMQELKWMKTSDGWKIISERDVKVIS
jgi:uncharacterized protein YndB with AHSA1/START domain